MIRQLDVWSFSPLQKATLLLEQVLTPLQKTAGFSAHLKANLPNNFLSLFQTFIFLIIFLLFNFIFHQKALTAVDMVSFLLFGPF